jgi:hypothetical protein
MAGSQAVLGPGLFVGRLASIVAAGVAAALLGWMAARQGRGWAAAALAILVFLSLGFPTPFPWFALYKEDMLGVTLGVASMAVLLSGQGGWRTVAAALLAALAILTKQTLIAAFVGGTLALALHDRREALRFVAWCVAPVAVVCGFFELTTHAFLANTVFANAQPVRLDVFQTNLATLKAYQAGPLAVAGFSVLRRLVLRRSFEDTLLPLYWLGTLVPLVGLAAVGSAQNYWIELAASSALLCAVEIWTWLRGLDVRSRVLGAILGLAPLVNIIVAGRLALIWLPALSIYADPAGTQLEFATVVERVRATAGDVVAEPLDALVLAGKPTLVEPWASDTLYQSGTWDIQPLVAYVCAGQVQLAVLSHPLEEDVKAYHDYGLWPAPLLGALRQTMVLEGVRAGRYVYVRRADARCGTLNV